MRISMSAVKTSAITALSAATMALLAIPASAQAGTVATGEFSASAMLLAAAPAQAAVPDANGPQGSNNNVTVYTAYTGSGYQVWAEFRHTTVHDGHLDVWGPNLSRRSSPNGYWPAGRDTARWFASGSGTVCAEGWSRVGGRWNSVGLPCVTI